MFDLITGQARHLPSHSTLPVLLSTTAQTAATAVALALPAMFVAEKIPEIPTMLAFVTPLSPTPAPPAAPSPGSAPGKPAMTQPATSSSTAVTPVEVPNTIQPEPSGTQSGPPPSVEDGVPGGVDGGVPGGIAGGVVGGLPEPPPQPPPEDRAPVRVGGSIQEPTLLRRVEPAYPPIAVSARLQGLVILEALVDRDGTIADIKVLRSAGPVLDREALIAVRQWRYSPLVLNGQRKSFVVTVTLSFSVEIERSNPSYAVRAK